MIYDGYRSKNGGFIEFKDPQVAAELLLKREIQMEDGNIKIESVGIHYQRISDNNSNFGAITENDTENDPVLQAPQTKSPHNILNALDDHCLYEIFNQFDTLSMLFSIANTCVRFSKVAKEVFTSKFKDKTICIATMKWGQLKMPQVIPVLYHFGLSIDSLYIGCIDIDGDYGGLPLSSYFLKIINKYCKHLTNLSISFENLNSQTLTEISPLLSRLKKLCFHNFFSFNLFSEFITICSQLETFEIYPPCLSNFTLPAITLPKLKKFHLLGTEDNVESIEPFLMSNPQLEIIEISFPSNIICRCIGQYMTNLRELELNDWQYELNDIENINLDIEHLRGIKLKWHGNYQIIASHIQQLIESDVLLIEDVSVWNTSIDRAVINNICQLKTIKALGIDANSGDDENYLIELTRNLPNLEKFRITYSALETVNYVAVLIQVLKYANRLKELSFCLFDTDIVPYNENDYNAVLEIIKKRADHRKFKFRIETQTRTKYEESSTKCIYLDIEPDLVFEYLIEHY